jgi:hypothetical protein
MRGRPLIYVALALAAWSSARVMLHQPPRSDQILAAPEIAVKPHASKLAQADEAAPIALTQLRMRTHRIFAAKTPPTSPSFIGSHPALVPWQDGGRPSGLSLPALVAGSGEPLSTGRDTPPTIALAPVGKAGPPEQQRRWAPNIYAYSFWRLSSGGVGTLAPGAQYGGSQSGIVATLDPFGTPGRGVGLLLRGYVTPDGAEGEAALGARWKPAAKLPVSLSLERRFRKSAPDVFAAYLAGGVDDVALKGRFKLSAYAQAGVVGNRLNGFFDAQARVMRPVAKTGDVEFFAGAGSWAGGQKGAQRLDVGPTVEVTFTTDLATFRLQADWRQRAAGNARPAGGATLTLSTGF